MQNHADGRAVVGNGVDRIDGRAVRSGKRDPLDARGERPLGQCGHYV